jgi:hypothetical protein
MKKGTEEFAALLGGIAVIVCVALSVGWVVWCLWTWVLPELWPEGPESFTKPGYWVFLGAWLLLGLIGRNFRRDSK